MSEKGQAMMFSGIMASLFAGLFGVVGFVVPSGILLIVAVILLAVGFHT